MTWVEWTSIFILGVNVFFGAFRGLIREILSLTGLIIGNYISIIWSPILSPIFVKYLKLNPTLSHILTYILILFPILIFFQMIIYIAKSLIKAFSLGFFDKFGGAFFGFLKGIIWVTILILFLILFPLPKETREYLDKNSYLIKKVKGIYIRNYINQVKLPNWKLPFDRIKIPIKLKKNVKK